MSDQLAYERRLIAGSGALDLLKEMFTIPGNRKRTLISIGLMICQQMTGKSNRACYVKISSSLMPEQEPTPSTTMLLKSSPTWA